MIMNHYRAAILDMDGVLTRTAKVHASAWKVMFDDFLEQRFGADFEPFRTDVDYRKYVDGKPRYDGVRSFLESRDIHLPEGRPSDPLSAKTVYSLGNRKNRIFRELIEKGVETYEDAVEQVREWKTSGVRVAVISASRNCERVLESASLLQLFDVKVDGDDLDRLDIAGKPAPDMFLHAAHELGAKIEETMIAEDAIAGVKAGRKGKFGLVVGVSRVNGVDELYQAGADLVVRDMRELRVAKYCPPGRNCLKKPLPALDHSDWMIRQVRDRPLALFLDYDGTLTPIVRRPEDAVLTEQMRALLRELGEHCPVAIVSGRDRADAEKMVQVDSLVYAGSHGFDIRGPGDLRMQHPEAEDRLSDIDQAEKRLRDSLTGMQGARVERKKYAIAIHYREVSQDADVARIEEAVDRVRKQFPSLRKMEGKKIFELQPDVEWDKGRAVLWLRESLHLDDPERLTFYIGDDVTDEDAFQRLRQLGIGIGIRVGEPGTQTQALFYLKDPAEVEDFLGTLLELQKATPEGNRTQWQH